MVARWERASVKLRQWSPVGFIFIVVASEMVKGECDVDHQFAILIPMFLWPTRNMFVSNGNVPPKKKEQQILKKRTRSGFIDFIRTLVAL